TPSLRVGLELYFDGPFLVNDPSQCTDEDNDITEDGNKKPDHAPLCDKNGKAYLPGKAVRGPVRSQAERILRTLREDVACRVTDRNDACKAVYTEDEVREKEKLCMACHVFGASGWRTLVDFSDFHEVNDHQESFDQEFVAIDRFIGGVSGSAKFDAKAVYKPILKGEVTVDLDRIPLWGLGLLALTLRDLIEGDTQFGFGSGKGYAACTAKITSLTSVALEKYKALEELRERHKIDPDELTQLDVSGIPRQEIQNMLGDIVGLFHTAVKEFRRSVPVQGGING
ncbi:MAG: RAMP superfamily CRISPR-associated protein, partial [Chloroflexota bacterium]|nr:RAMP superfamily CRISPR-associated protein [Chloroflexota bacterium]